MPVDVTKQAMNTISHALAFCRLTLVHAHRVLIIKITVSGEKNLGEFVFMTARRPSPPVAPVIRAVANHSEGDYHDTGGFGMCFTRVYLVYYRVLYGD